MRRKLVFIIVLIVTLLCVSLIPITVGETDNTAHITTDTFSEITNIR
jgi:hypothetical protein